MRALGTVPRSDETGGAEPGEHPATARYHEHLYNLYRLKTDAFEKAILTIDCGALALSITFLEKIAGTKRLWWPALVVGWAALICALLATLLTIYFSAESMLTAAREYPWVRDPNDRAAPTETGGWSARATTWCNRLAIAGTIIGIAALALFSFKNVGGR